MAHYKSGDKIGKWEILNIDTDVNNRDLSYLCKCICGTVKKVKQYHLKAGKSQSCGCYKSEWVINNKTTHGGSHTKLYKTWCNIKERCYNINAKDYKNYGGRGIKMCDRWLESFENFYADMGNKPTPNHSIDRDDVNGDYCKENCKWATNDEQRRNKRSTVYIYYNNEKIVQADFVKRFNIVLSTFIRKYKNGMDLDTIIKKFGK